MWETKRTKTVVINILLILFIIVIVGGLVMGMRYVSRISATQDAQLSEIYSQQKQEQKERRGRDQRPCPDDDHGGQRDAAGSGRLP